MRKLRLMVEDLNPQEYLDRLRHQFPDIRPYGEDDWDWNWADEGMEALEAGDYAWAEYRFQQLIASQPNHSDGYEGLALVYQALGFKRQALILIEEAFRIAKEHRQKDWIDQEVLDEIRLERERIRAMPDEAEEAVDVGRADPEEEEPIP